VEPSTAVLKGGSSAKFTVRFASGRAVRHTGYLHGVQRVFSPEVRCWNEGLGSGQGWGE